MNAHWSCLFKWDTHKATFIITDHLVARQIQGSNTHCITLTFDIDYAVAHQSLPHENYYRTCPYIVSVNNIRATRAFQKVHYLGCAGCRVARKVPTHMRRMCQQLNTWLGTQTVLKQDKTGRCKSLYWALSWVLFRPTLMLIVLQVSTS